MDITAERLGQLFSALGEHLGSEGASFELVVIGGSALEALGLVRRGTKDVDVLALREGEKLLPAYPFPPVLEAAKKRVALDFDLPENWLNSGPTTLLDFGLPKGLWDRIETEEFGPALTVHFAGRLDQIHFKLFAMVDQGGGRHEADLRTLVPTEEELLLSARWTITQDPSPGFRQMLLQALEILGVTDVDFDA